MKMPDNLKERLTVPLEIPMWSVLTIIGSIIFGAGAIMNKLDTLVENGRKYESKVDLLFERQVQNITNVANIQAELQRVNSRLHELEAKK